MSASWAAIIHLVTLDLNTLRCCHLHVSQTLAQADSIITNNGTNRSVEQNSECYTEMEDMTKSGRGVNLVDNFKHCRYSKKSDRAYF